MKQSLQNLGTLLIFLLLVGCGTNGKDFSSDKVQNIQNNVTTQSEILDWFGVPFKEGIENTHTMWTYQLDKWYALAETKSKDLVILFDEKNIVKAYRFTSSIDE
ncbi:MAG: hypothetical protein O3A78_11475 [Nitrospinae bacterium]|nr:hypothetical protein [Nitrospinota bacterium]MDA1110407.1 hypothetical protein [Nitrospinota bacterium]